MSGGRGAKSLYLISLSSPRCGCPGWRCASSWRGAHRRLGGGRDGWGQGAEETLGGWGGKGGKNPRKEGQLSNRNFSRARARAPEAPGPALGGTEPPAPALAPAPAPAFLGPPEAAGGGAWEEEEGRRPEGASPSEGAAAAAAGGGAARERLRDGDARAVAAVRAAGGDMAAGLCRLRLRPRPGAGEVARTRKKKRKNGPPRGDDDI